MSVCKIALLILPAVLCYVPTFAGENPELFSANVHQPTLSIYIAQKNFNNQEGEEEMLNDLFDNFDEDDNIDFIIQESRSASESVRSWAVNGDITLSGHYNFAHEKSEHSEADFRGISRQHVKLSLDGSAKLSDDWDVLVTGSGYYDAAKNVADEEKKEVEIGETFIRGRLTSKLDLKFGRQIVVWGMSDNLRVTDILNPLNNRTPGIIEIKDRRLPLVMTRLDYYYETWNISAITIHEIRFNKNPAFGSEFNSNKNHMSSEEIPSDGGSNEFALALNGSFQGWDISFYGAELFDDQAYLEKSTNGHKLKHGRYKMFGFAADAVVFGSYIFKAESAHFLGLNYSHLPGKKKRIEPILCLQLSTMGFPIQRYHLRLHSGTCTTMIQLIAMIHIHKMTCKPLSGIMENLCMTAFNSYLLRCF